MPSASFAKKTWYDHPSGGTPTDAGGWNDQEDRIDAAFQTVEATLTAVPTNQVQRTTLTGVTDDNGANVRGIVVTAKSDTENAVVVRRRSSAWGSPFVYGDSQAFLLIKEGTGSVRNDLVLARIDGRSGGAGFAGGIHSAGGLHRDVGDAVATQNVWVQNTDDMVGIVVEGVAVPTKAYQLWEDGSANLMVSVTKDGVLAAYAADSTYGSAYVSSRASATPATLALGTGGAAVDATLGVAGVAGNYTPVSNAKDTVLKGINGGLIFVAGGVAALSISNTTGGLFVGSQVAMNSNKIAGLGPGTVGTSDAARMVDIPRGATYFPVFGFGASTATAPVANTIYYGRVNVLNTASLTGVFIWNGGTASGNAIVSLFDSSGNRVAVSSSTAVTGTNVVQKIPFTGAYLASTGIYYAAVMFDNTTTRFFTTTGGLVPNGSATNASFAAPASITVPGGPAGACPVIGTY